MPHEAESDRWEEFYSGIDVACDHTADWTYERPSWLDVEKFRRGQEFGKTFLAGIIASNVIMLLNFSRLSRLRKPLTFTGNSKTVLLSYKRYFKTSLILLTWYDGNLWDRDNGARKNMELVKKLHLYYSSKTNQKRNEVDSITIYDSIELPVDLATKICPIGEIWCREGDSPYFSQFDMSMTQYAFCGLVLTYPEKFGIHYASREDLESFSHFWRGIGYILGIEDRYNLCTGSLETVQTLCKSIENRYVRPAFIDIDLDTMIAQKVIVEGLKMEDKWFSYEAMMHYTASHVLNMNPIKALKPVGFFDWCSFFSLYIMFNYLYRIRWVCEFFSRKVEYRLHKSFFKEFFRTERTTIDFPLPKSDLNHSIVI